MTTPKLFLPFFLSILFCLNLNAQCPGTPPLAFTFESTESRCESNGTITLHISGGTPFSSPGGPIYNNTIIAPTVTPIGGQEDTVFAALAADTYTVEVADANGCTVTHVVTVPGTHMQLELTPTWSDATCDGLGGGWICGTPDEGRPWPPGYYEYQLFDATTSPPTPLGPKGLDSCFTDLAAGSYQIRAFDSCNNFQTRDVILAANSYSSQLTMNYFRRVETCDTGCVIIYIYEPFNNQDPWGEFPYSWEVISADPVLAELIGETGQLDDYRNWPTYDQGDTLCYDPPYADGNFVIQFTDVCGTVTTRNVSVPGFRVFARDGYDCVEGGYAYINNSYTPNCADGTVTYEVISGPTGFPIPPPQDTGYWANLPTGNYCFRITDCCGNVATDCEGVASPAWTVSLDTSSILTCVEGWVGFSLNYRTNGGPFATGLNSIVTSAPAGYPNPIPDTLTHYFADIEGPVGTYCVLMFDECNYRDSICFLADDTIIYDPTINVIPGCVTGNQLEIIRSSNFKLEYDLWRATPTYLYLGGDQTQTNWTNLIAGSYVIRWENHDNSSSNFCFLRYDTVVIPDYIPPSIVGAWGIECTNGAGLITVQGSHGNAPYTYELFQGPVTRPLQSSPSFPGLPVGTYDIRLNDNCNNSEIATVSIEPFVPTIQGYGGSFCQGDTAVLYVDYFNLASYSWSGPNGITSDTSVLIIPNIMLSDSGTYTIDIDVKNPDQTACVAQSLNIVVEVFDCSCMMEPFSTTMVDCNGATTGAATASATSAAGGPFTYVWSNGGNTQTISNLGPGTYMVTITDVDGCSVTGDTTITEPSALAVTGSVNNVICAAFRVGSVDITPTGGTTMGTGCTGYTYNWSNGQTTQDIQGLSAGTYAVTVTDCNGCSITDSYTVTGPTLGIGISTFLTNVSCNGANNGYLNILPSGGTVPIGNCNGYSFNWSHGPSTQNVSNLSPGMYSVTVSDCNNCSNVGSFTITEPTLLSCTTTSSNVNCAGGANGTASTTATGGTSPYSYLWNNGAATATINNLTAGTYTVTITDANNCTSVCSTTVSEPAAHSCSVSTTNVSCAGGADGTATATTSNGTAPYTYQWNNGASTSTINNLTTGTYTVTVTDANNCTSVCSSTISEPAVLSCSTSSTSISCAGGTDGSVSVTVTGGAMPYTYLWNNGATTQNQTNLSVGFKTVTVTDANNCTTTCTEFVSQPIALTFNSTPTSIRCNGESTGGMDITPLGGTTTGPSCSGYSFIWSNGATTEDLTNVPAGAYSITISDCNGCTRTWGFTLGQAAALTLTGATTNVSCSGEANGSIDITPGGGTGGINGYTYAWSNGATTQDINNLAAGTYSVTLMDVYDCSMVQSYTITEPAAFSCSINSTNTPCAGAPNGTAVASATGGSMPYSYLWNTGAITASLNNLAAGTYTVTVTDANNCISTCSTIITQPASGLVSIAFNILNIDCYGDATGSATYQTSGGTPPYTLNWSTGQQDNNVPSNGQSTATGLSAGTYFITITDANNCTLLKSFTINQNPDLIAAVLNVVEPNCFGESNGQATYNPSGGVPPYDYTWDSGETTQTATSLSAGFNYTTVTDVLGCTKTYSLFLFQPPLLTCMVGSTPVTCNGGSDGAALATVTGGTLNPGNTNYQYLWNTGATTAGIINLTAGNYTVTVTDDNGCTTTCSVDVVEPDPLVISLTGTNLLCNNDNTGMIDMTVTGGNDCNTACLTDAGGITPDFTGSICYVISPVTLTATPDGSAVVPSGYQVVYLLSTSPTNTIGFVNTIPSFNAIGAGIYTIHTLVFDPNTVDLATINPGVTTLTDINNLLIQGGGSVCGSLDVKGASFTVINCQFKTPPSKKQIAQSKLDLEAYFNNSIQPIIDYNAQQQNLINGKGGSNFGNADTYLWSNGETTEDITGLSAGTYTVTVTDCKGCVATGSITISEPPVLTATATGTNLLCNGDNSGSIDLTVTGGTPGYTYNWSNGMTSEDPTGLAAGTYLVTVTDDNGCMATTSVTLTEPAVLSASATGTNLLCFEDSSGSINLTVTGGTVVYSYLWSNGMTVEDPMNLAAGTYMVTVTDMNGCIATTSATLIEPPLLSVTATSTAVTCYAGSDGTASATVTGGTPGYNYEWSTGAITKDITGLTVGTYTVTVTDANECTATTSVVVVEPPVYSCDMTVVSHVSCYGYMDGIAMAGATGGTPGYTYQWGAGAHNQTSQSASGLAAGTYNVTVTDSQGCPLVCSVTINQPPKLEATIDATDVSCFSDSDGTATVTATGGVPSYTYQWDSGQTGPTATGLFPGTYSVSITDMNGCCYIASAVIGAPVCDPCQQAEDGVLDICAEIDADPNHPLATLDCDNGGVINSVECMEGTDPLDPSDDCSAAVSGNLDICILMGGDLNHPLASEDCDNGGVINILECISGEDPTNPTDDCQTAIDEELNICALINFDPNHPLANADCDGGGVINITECNTGEDPSDPGDDCEAAVEADMDICAIIAGGGHPWATLDCDHGGVDNETECNIGGDPNDPQDDPTCPIDPCVEAEYNGDDICTILDDDPNHPLATLDCDNGGVDNQTECDNGADPSDPEDDCDAAEAAGMNICAIILLDPAHPLADVDCDNGGVSNIDECNSGEDPFEPSDDCQSALDLNLNICALINYDPNHPLASLDCDNGGVMNITECNTGEDPSDPDDDCEAAAEANLDICAMILAGQTGWASLDCDHGGIINSVECANGDDPSDPQDDLACPSDPCEEAAANNMDVCAILTADPTNPIGTLDCDNGGVDNQTECDNGGDPTDPNDDCSIAVLPGVDICTILTNDPSNPLSTKDCDNGGVNNEDECNNGGDPTIPDDDCQVAINGGLNICALINYDPNHPLAQLDCDAGGVRNIVECNTGEDPANPDDDCEAAVEADMDICMIIGVGGHPWATLDCDRGGVDNETECANGTDPNDPIDDPTCPVDLCVDATANNTDICAVIAADPNSPLATLDCDNGGIDNQTECNNGGDPNDPADECTVAGTPGVDLCAILANDPSNPLATLDCDNGGVTNIDECNNGGDPFDPSDDCTIALGAGMDLCLLIGADPNHPLATLDCDNGGINNYIECTNGGDPADPADDCWVAVTADIDICGMILTTGLPWGSLDCDNGGIDNGTECTTGGDPNDPSDDVNCPLDPCQFAADNNTDICVEIANNPNSPLATEDCDNGGIDNQTECNNGGDPNDPDDDCTMASAPGVDICAILTADPDNPLADIDCDNGGVSNQDECDNSGDPFDPTDDCQVAMDGSLNICLIIFGDPNHPLASLDCDNGGIDNYTECISGEDPTNPTDDCQTVIDEDLEICSIIIGANGDHPLATLDCDNGGVDNTHECQHMTDTNEPSDDCVAAIRCNLDICDLIDGDPNHPLADQDCDGGGMDNWSECQNGGDPNNPADDCIAAVADTANICLIIYNDPDHPMASSDCDNGGVPNWYECQNGEDPLNPADDCNTAIDIGGDICTIIITNPTSPVATLDCDGGGIDNGTECANGGDPADPIDDCLIAIATGEDICSIIGTNPNHPMAGVDCDNGGIDNGTECANGGDPADPADDCTVAKAAGVDVCAIIAYDPNHPLATKDCDNGGVDNYTECVDAANDPCDPADDCNSAVESGMDICAILVANPGHPWASMDCDNGGIDNETECADGGDPSDPIDDGACPPDLCEEAYNGNMDICTVLSADPNDPMGTMDCDNGGIDNQTECDNGGDPIDGEDDCAMAIIAGYDLCALINGDPAHPMATLDCDGGGVNNITECATGEDPSEPSDDCMAAIDEGLNICQLINYDPAHPMAILDCDNGGIDNWTECQNGGDPSDPVDDCQVVITEELDICTILTNDPDNPIGNADCDADGVTNATECADGTDPLDPCDFVDTSITLPVTADQSGCPNLCPDLTPITTILPGNIAGISGVCVSVEVSELIGIDTDSSTITVTMPSDPRVTFVWEPVATSCGLLTYNNADWTYLGNNGFVHTFVYNNSSQIIAGGSSATFGFNAVYDPQSTDGQTTITATIRPFSGGECNILNNTDSERLVYFE